VEIVAVVNHKGGVGKTTTAANLGAALAEFGKRVLLVDLDPQAALTSMMGHRLDHSALHALHVLDPDLSVPVDQAILPTRDEKVALLPSGLTLANLEPRLVASGLVYHYLLDDALRAAADSYDYALVDTPQGIGVLTAMAVIAADWLLVPVATQRLAFRGVTLLEQVVPRLRRSARRPEAPMRLLRTMMRRTLHDREIAEAVERAYPGAVFATIITQSVIHADASVGVDGGSTVLWRFPGSPAAQRYRDLAAEVLEFSAARRGAA
jgi:chromosome partitioning protein